jgi:glutamate 5-kinase
MKRLLMTINSRSDIPRAKRIVVKVGSSSISGDNAHQIVPLVSALAQAHGSGAEVILVSSGAMATGYPFIKLTSRPTDLPTLQAAAAVGQSRLMLRYQSLLDHYNIVSGQVLLTSGDFEDESSRTNAAAAMEKLLELRVMPIVNENDTVATQEIRFGDNDRLAALVAQLVHADVLVLLSDVDGIYTKPPGKDGSEQISEVTFGQSLTEIEFGNVDESGVGSGGAQSKAAAAEHAASSGTATLITHAALVGQALRGENVGTWFHAK